MVKQFPAVFLVVCLALRQVVASTYDVEETASKVQNGASLSTRTTEQAMQDVGDGYVVVCGVEVENWTKWPMDSPIAEAEAGYITLLPSVIMPGTREVMVAHKGSYSATGSFGAASWIINPPSGIRRVVVMWSVPLSFMSSNWLAVGVTPPNDEDYSDGWAEQMFYEDSDLDFQFVRGEYYDETIPITFNDGTIAIVASMETGYWPKVRVDVRPTHSADLAPALK